MERKLIAIMSVDVAGYSRLMNEDEVGTLATLNSHMNELVEPCVERHHGRIVKLMGDGALIEFPSVVGAVQCAHEVQTGIAERNVDQPHERRIEFRIGVNLGDVIVEGDDIFGDGVNVAARLEGLAEPGGICISGAAAEQVRKKLDLAFHFDGEHRLKNIAEPVPVYRVSTESPAAQTQGKEHRPELPEKPSIAVLPFDNLSGDVEQEYFSDGITEDIITELSRFRNLFVIARNSTFAYKGKPVNIQQVGRELGVQYVLEGSVRKSGDRIRVTAQLIDAGTEHHIRAERYDRRLEDVFAVQDELTETIVATLEGQVEVAARVRAERKYPENLKAYDFMLRGRAIIAHTAKDNLRAREMYQRAAELAPDSARAWTGLALTHMLDFTSRWSDSPKKSLEEAFTLATKAVALDESDSDTHRVLGSILVYRNELEQARAHLERALQLNPNHATPHCTLGGIYIYLGQPREALETIEAAIRLNPHHPSWYLWHLAFALLMSEKYESAIATLRNALARYQDFVTPRRHLAVCFMRLDQPEKARAEVREILKLDPGYSLKRLAERLPFQEPAQRDAYLDDLRRAGVP